MEPLDDGMLATDAAVALSSQGDKRAVPVLIREITYSGEMLMSDAGIADKWGYALARLNDPRALNTLIGILSNSEDRISIRLY